MRTLKIMKSRIMNIVRAISKIKNSKRMIKNQANKASQKYINQPQIIF